MIIKQLSVFVENRRGRLVSIAETLAKADVDISALSLADTSDFGVLRLIVDKPEAAKAALNEEGVVVKITDVVAAVMDDQPGGVAATLRVLQDSDIDVEYMYACVGKTTGKALVVIKPSDVSAAEDALTAGGYGAISPSDIYRI
ncbi:MAG: hypothetical protein Q4F70_04495 [Clostridia bacterium]|nr:hypothetical protein [Clostridia bacterium]